ncbi:MAG: ATP-dependent zinc metalloprotease FtsH [Proteobacteria bacterium]|nr:ATP-dependent zinc metalloprotease FtsH [Pseudomonadota bacterium]
MFVSVFHLFATPTRDDGRIDFSEFVQDVAKSPEKIRKVQVKGTRYTIEYADRRVRTTGQELDSALRERLDKANIPYAIEEREEGGFWQSMLVSWLPMIFIFVIFFVFMRQLQAGGGKAMSFGKSRAKLLSDHHHKVTFADVAGAEEAKHEVQEIVEFLRDPKRFTRLGGRIPKGVLMIGPPGTGKTLLARAIAGEAGVPFFSISGSDFVEMFVGVGASRVRDLFEQGKKNAPCIIFIDEIDAVGRHRGAGLGGGHDEREQTLNQLLVEMDGFESNEGVILIAATNRPDVLDPALLRPGRFDRRITVPRPDVRGREAILQVHTRRTPTSPDVNLALLARGTPGFSGADLESMVNEAALQAARTNKDHIEQHDFEYAKDKVLMGSERRSLFISEKEKRNTAFHEAGHVLVAKSMAQADPVHKVTIIPRGQALGLTQQLPEEDRMSVNETYARTLIAILMGGRVAEELVFGEVSTGGGNDIERATDIAHKMVCEWGMSRKLGPLAYGKREEPIFLGRELGRARDYSERTAEDIDTEVRSIVEAAHQQARQVIERSRVQLDALAAALLEVETLDGQQIDDVIAARPLRPRPVPAAIGAVAGGGKDAEGRAKPGVAGPLIAAPGLSTDPKQA